MQLNNISFCHSEPASLAGEESALAGLKQIPRAIKLPFGMTLFKLPHYPFFRLGPFFGVESAWITAGGRGTLLSR